MNYILPWKISRYFHWNPVPETWRSCNESGSLSLYFGFMFIQTPSLPSFNSLVETLLNCTPNGGQVFSLNLTSETSHLMKYLTFSNFSYLLLCCWNSLRLHLNHHSIYVTCVTSGSSHLLSSSTFSHFSCPLLCCWNSSRFSSNPHFMYMCDLFF